MEDFYGKINLKLSEDRYFGENFEKVKEVILKEVYS
jgi:histidine ammonia-lyase